MREHDVMCHRMCCYVLRCTLELCMPDLSLEGMIIEACGVLFSSVSKQIAFKI